MMDKPMQVNALTLDQQDKFRDAPMPEVKKVIFEKHDAGGEAIGQVRGAF